MNKNYWEWKIQVHARQYNLFLLYFIFGSFNIRRDYMVSGNLIREYSLIGWLLFDVNRSVCYLLFVLMGLFLHQYKYVCTTTSFIDDATNKKEDYETKICVDTNEHDFYFLVIYCFCSGRVDVIVL